MPPSDIPVEVAHVLILESCRRFWAERNTARGRLRQRYVKLRRLSVL